MFPTVFRDDDEFKLVRADVTWSLEASAPALLAKLAEAEPAVPALARGLAARLPVQRTWAFGRFGSFVRPDRHNRAVYVDLATLSAPGLASAGGCVAIKGSEAACDDLDVILDRLARSFAVYGSSLGGLSRQLFRDPVLLSALDRYPVTEGKPPAVHTHADAVEEAELALALQEAHLARYGALARAPLPVLVLRFPDDIAAAALQKIEPRLSEKAARIVRAELAGGLGAYVYHYPCVPLRVMHVQAPDALGVPLWEERLAILGRHGDVGRAIEGWIELTSRLLVLGFVPTDPSNANRGYCIQPQNLVVDGGFVDMNSLRRIATFRTQGEFTFALTRTLQFLVHGISWFLVGTQAAVDSFRESFPEVHARVSDEVRSRVRTAQADGAELHPWLADAVHPRGVVADLLRAFRPVLELGVAGGQPPLRAPGAGPRRGPRF